MSSDNPSVLDLLMAVLDAADTRNSSSQSALRLLSQDVHSVAPISLAHGRSTQQLLLGSLSNEHADQVLTRKRDECTHEAFAYE